MCQCRPMSYLSMKGEPLIDRLLKPASRSSTESYKVNLKNDNSRAEG